MAEKEGSSRRRGNPDAEASNRNPFSPNPFLSPMSLPSFKSVTLHDWWLVQSEGNRIAVEGFASKPAGTRQFCSAPIVKRHDSLTLETADGFTVIIGGMINRLRTLQNGFPVSMCNHFVLGFPFDWEEVTAQFYSSSREECSSSATHPLISLMAASFDDLSIIELRDLAMEIPLGCENQLWDLVEQQHKNDVEGGSGDKGGSNGEEGERQEKGSSEVEGEGKGVVVVTPPSRSVVVAGRRDGGVVTRSMSGKKKQQQEEAEEEIVVKGSERKNRSWKVGRKRKYNVAAVRSGRR